MSSNIRIGRPIDHAKDEAILCAARELLFSKGLAKLSMEAVARQAGVSKVTLYSRFDNKNALIEASIRDLSTQLVTHLALMPEERKKPRAALHEFGVTLLTFILSKENLSFLCLLGSVSDVDKTLVNGIYSAGVEASAHALRDWLVAEQERGHLSCSDPAFGAEMFLSMLAGLEVMRALHHLPTRKTSEEIDAHVEKVVSACLHVWGLATPDRG